MLEPLFGLDAIFQTLASYSNDWLHCWFMRRCSSLFCNADLRLEL